MGSTVRTLSPFRRFSCKKCGGRLDIPLRPTNDTIISCKACGVVLGRWAAVKREMKETTRNTLMKKARQQRARLVL
jgi:hypothetical protein